MDLTPFPFLSLPWQLRRQIYFFAHLVRECPVAITAPANVIVRHDAPRRTEKEGWGWCCQYQQRKQLGRHNIAYETRECRCPEIPKQLLLLSKALHAEVEALLYGENKFIIRAHRAEDLDLFEKLSVRALSQLRYLLVRLNSWPCYRGHSRASFKHGVCLECRAPVSASDAELGADNAESEAIIEQWSRACSRLSSHVIPGRLSVEFICDVMDKATAERVLGPLGTLPRLNECTIRLGRNQDAALRSLARSAAIRLTEDLCPPSSAAVSSFFPFQSLPPELRLRVLGFTNLGPNGSFRPEWSDIAVKNGRFEQAICSSLAVERECCLSCSFTRLDCCCPLRSASYSLACRCRDLPLELLLVNRQTRTDAAMVLYSTNTFTFTGPFLDSLRMLQSLRPDTLRRFRRICFQLETRQTVRWKDLADTWGLLVAFIGKFFDISRLSLIIKADSNDYEECTDPTYNEPMLRNLYTGYRTLVLGVKAQLPNLLDFHLMLGAFYSLEPVWEKHVMGSGYDSTNGNQFSKEAHSTDRWPNLPKDLTEAPHWHQEL
ncbi:unnamed protein product [Clonostachys rhizophaga]|uniref:Uncharacterized protein n=1 Tax=Clonostachys rhizophaga TaxID=160324 RepID=A0A9N9YLN9_9HYPO|nr:unnamed protein product [Clonostachys rhizophaga]